VKNAGLLSLFEFSVRPSMQNNIANRLQPRQPTHGLGGAEIESFQPQWREEIERALEKTTVAILLISADFLATEWLTMAFVALWSFFK
jgi:hypothetical protein